MDTVHDAIPWIADALVVIALFTMTIGVFGLATMPDIYTKIHASSKAVFLGAVALMLASFATGQTAVISRALLIIGALIVTTPISAHTISNAAVRRNDRMRSEGAINESPFLLDKADSPHVGDAGDARLRTLLGE